MIWIHQKLTLYDKRPYISRLECTHTSEALCERDDNIPGQRRGEADYEPGGEEERLAEDEDLPSADHVGQEAEDERAEATRRYPCQNCTRKIDIVVQGDHSLCCKPPVDTKTKVPG